MKKILVVMFLSLHVFAFDLGSTANTLLSNQAPKSSETPNSSLISMLTSNLGVSSSQAIGGASAILSRAASNMRSSDVSSLTSALPSLSSLIGSNQDSKSSVLGSLISTSSLTSQFKTLGMDSSMVGKFTTVILEFINSNAGKALMQSVQSALK